MPWLARLWRWFFPAPPLQLDPRAEFEALRESNPALYWSIRLLAANISLRLASAAFAGAVIRALEED